MKNYSEILASASETLRAAGIERPRHEAEIILSSMAIRYAFLDDENFSKNCAGLPTSREEIAAHPDREISKAAAKLFSNFVNARAEHQPLAYLLEEKEFYGREFIVTPDVLIPRPETEVLIDFAKDFSTNFARKNTDQQIPRILDLGTGSGAIAVTLHQEIPHATIFASDISEKALQVAQKNAFLINNFTENIADHSEKTTENIFAKNHPAQIGGITFLQSNLLENIGEKFDLIVANLPYVDENWEVSPETKFEPKRALFANNGGMELMKKFIATSDKNLAKNGEIILELDTRQIDEMTNFAERYDFKVKKSTPFALWLAKNSVQ